MSALDGAPRASFDKIEFPFLTRTMRSEFRHHVHEFPKMAGGDPEKLGRKVWVVSYECELHASNLYFENLYPAGLNALQDRFERGVTAELVVPEVGIIRAFLTKFERRRKSSILSGEGVSMEFLEDDLQPFRSTNVTANRSSLADAEANLSELLFPTAANTSGLANIEAYQKPLGSLMDLVNSVLAIRDQIELLGARVAAQLHGLAALCRELHEQIQGPDLYPLREALRDLWDATTTLQQDLLNKGPGSALVTYVTPTVMSTGQIAQALYGEASRGGEILALNTDISDPFAVDAGLPLIVYAA